MTLSLPSPVELAIVRLEQHGFSAYAVGGCVRDSLLGRVPQDWDLATNAAPEQTMECFRDFRTIGTGLRHGTVTVLVDGMQLEVTTFRVEEGYSDHRRPDKVRFTESLRQDTARRDFTINSMAYHPRLGLRDFHGGAGHLQQRLLACVGDPDRRFSEDALRIFRAVRLASQLGFSIHADTANSLLDHCRLLDHIARERLSAELDKALLGAYLAPVFHAYAPVVFQVIPDLRQLAESRPELWRTALRGVAAAPKHRTPRLALLLCDTGAAGDILRRLRYPGAVCRSVEELVAMPKESLTNHPRTLRRQISGMGEERFFLLLAFWRARALAENNRAGVELVGRSEAAARMELTGGRCLRLGDLAVRGGDLAEAGVPPGPHMGELLRELLEKVQDQQLNNQREVLLSAAKAAYLKRAGDIKNLFP